MSHWYKIIENSPSLVLNQSLPVVLKVRQGFWLTYTTTTFFHSCNLLLFALLHTLLRKTNFDKKEILVATTQRKMHKLHFSFEPCVTKRQLSYKNSVENNPCWLNLNIELLKSLICTFLVTIRLIAPQCYICGSSVRPSVCLPVGSSIPPSVTKISTPAGWPIENEDLSRWLLGTKLYMYEYASKNIYQISDICWLVY